jgi:hypothetical protein
LTAGLPVGPTRLGIEIVGSSLRYDDAANQVKMGGYGTINLTAEWAVGNGVTLFARADNVLDKNYELASGFARSGATVFAGVRARFDELHSLRAESAGGNMPHGHAPAARIASDRRCGHRDRQRRPEES